MVPFDDVSNATASKLQSDWKRVMNALYKLAQFQSEDIQDPMVRSNIVESALDVLSTKVSKFKR
jgi:hypothetical protein